MPSRPTLRHGGRRWPATSLRRPTWGRERGPRRDRARASRGPARHACMPKGSIDQCVHPLCSSGLRRTAPRGRGPSTLPSRFLAAPGRRSSRAALKRQAWEHAFIPEHFRGGLHPRRGAGRKVQPSLKIVRVRIRRRDPYPSAAQGNLTEAQLDIQAKPAPRGAPFTPVAKVGTPHGWEGLRLMGCAGGVPTTGPCHSVPLCAG